MSNALATIRGLQVSLGGRRILAGINADIARNKITALIGLNGSGKTTLLRALIREYKYRGEIKFFCGHDHTQHRPEFIGYVPQRLAIDQRIPLTVREFFALNLQRRPLFLGISSKAAQATDRLLKMVGAGHLINRPVAKLSGGELQRILLAIALEPKPELLLLDEPAAGIDFADQVPFYSLLSRINQEQGITMVIVSHDISIVSANAHHVLCLQNGKIVCEGPPQDILSSENLANTFGQGKKLYTHMHAEADCYSPTDACGHTHGFFN